MASASHTYEADDTDLLQLMCTMKMIALRTVRCQQYISPSPHCFLGVSIYACGEMIPIM